MGPLLALPRLHTTQTQSPPGNVPPRGAGGAGVELPRNGGDGGGLRAAARRRRGGVVRVPAVLAKEEGYPPQDTPVVVEDTTEVLFPVQVNPPTGPTRGMARTVAARSAGESLRMDATGRVGSAALATPAASLSRSRAAATYRRARPSTGG